ncbi:MAG: ActD-like protein [Candidatus Latescibacterota bacterium]
MSTKRASIPDLLLERYLLDELPPAEMAAVRQTAENDAEVRARLAALQDSTRQILERYPPAWVAGRVLARAGGVPSRAAPRRRVRRLAFALAAASAAVALPAVLTWRGPAQEEEERIKGAELLLFRRTPAGSEALSDSSVARQGDLLQIVYRSAGKRYGAIFSVDGRGTVTWHLPAAGSHAAALPSAGPDTLGFAYELDDAPHWERFYLVTAAAPFDLGLLQDAARAKPEPGGRLPLPAGFRQEVLTLRKVEGRG